MYMYNVHIYIYVYRKGSEIFRRQSLPNTLERRCIKMKLKKTRKFGNRVTLTMSDSNGVRDSEKDQTLEI